MASSPYSFPQLKQEAATQYDKLSYLETKKSELLEEKNSRETPEQERERLLKQVRSGGAFGDERCPPKKRFLYRNLVAANINQLGNSE